MGIQSHPASRQFRENFDNIDWRKPTDPVGNVSLSSQLSQHKLLKVELDCAKAFYNVTTHMEALEKLLAEREPGGKLVHLEQHADCYIAVMEHKARA